MSGFGNNPFDANNNASYDGCGRSSYDRRFFNAPFNSELFRYTINGTAGEGAQCALVHQQFLINFMANFNSQVLEGVAYTADGFLSCDRTDIQFPFGTILVRNLSTFPVTIIIEREAPAGPITETIPANSEKAIVANSIGRVRVASLAPGGAARVLLLFDIIYPANPPVV